MAPAGPVDPVARTEWSRLRRRAAATHHPDRGGDVAAYLASLAAVDAAFGIEDHSGRRGPGWSNGVSEVVAVRTWRGSGMRLARRTRHVTRTFRSRLPRSFPGARRTTDI
jgi:hypothetical protein